MLCILLSDRLLLLPVSRWFISVLFVSSEMKIQIYEKSRRANLD